MEKTVFTPLYYITITLNYTFDDIAFSKVYLKFHFKKTEFYPKCHGTSLDQRRDII